MENRKAQPSLAVTIKKMGAATLAQRYGIQANTSYCTVVEPGHPWSVGRIGHRGGGGQTGSLFLVGLHLELVYQEDDEAGHWKRTLSQQSLISHSLQSGWAMGHPLSSIRLSNSIDNVCRPYMRGEQITVVTALKVYCETG